MPYIVKEVVEKVQWVVAYECSRCKRRFDVGPGDLEIQEMLHWRNKCGYGSVWGDGTDVMVTLCQHCTHDLFKDFATFHEG